jgi:septum site-determining protein MinC
MGERAATDHLFATETMAELCARQGRVAEATAIYRQLLAGIDAADKRHERWTQRLDDLLAQAHTNGTRDQIMAPAMSAATPVRPCSATPNLRVVADAPAPDPGSDESDVDPTGLRLPLLIDKPIRSGQIIYAANTDLIVLANVNPGAQLIADGNIHIYGVLRGRAVAGAHGCTTARIFCQRLDSELIGIDTAYLVRDDLPAQWIGKSVQIVLQQGRCAILGL